MKDEIIIYQPDEQSVSLEVRIEEDKFGSPKRKWPTYFKQQETIQLIIFQTLSRKTNSIKISVGKKSLLTVCKQYRTIPNRQFRGFTKGVGEISSI